MRAILPRKQVVKMVVLFFIGSGAGSQEHDTKTTGRQQGGCVCEGDGNPV